MIKVISGKFYFMDDRELEKIFGFQFFFIKKIKELQKEIREKIKKLKKEGKSNKFIFAFFSSLFLFDRTFSILKRDEVESIIFLPNDEAIEMAKSLIAKI